MSPITTDNRHYVRRWLTAEGMVSEYARGLSLADLNAVWNDTTDELLRSHKSNAANGAKPIATSRTTPTTNVAATVRAITDNEDTTDMNAIPTIETPISNGQMDAAAQIAAGLQALLGNRPIDAEQVNAIVDAKLTSATDTIMELVTSAIADIKPQRAEMVLKNTDGTERGTLPATRHPKADLLCKVVHRRVPAFIVGPAGSGKTTAAEQVATALGLSFYVQGAATGSHEFLGFIDAHGVYQSTPFRHAFEHGGVFLADEIDSSDPAVLLVINSALANGVMSFPDSVNPVRKHADFRFIAAANTYGTGADREYVGRNQLDAATIDRFAFINWDYDEAMEWEICPNADWVKVVQSVRKSVRALKLRHTVSPRASLFGAELLAEGIPQDMVEDMVIWKGLTEADVNRVKSHIAYN